MAARGLCRYGRECRRWDCHFAHPDGRMIDEQGDGNLDPQQQQQQQQFFGGGAPGNYYGGAQGGRGAGYGGRGAYQGGAPQQQGWMPPAPAYSGPSWNPSSGGGFYEGDVGVNGYEGSDAPDDGGYEGYDDVDNLLAEAIDLEAETALKDTWVASARNCTCCKGFIYACSGQTCVLLGVCFCTAGELLDQEQQQAAEAALADAASQDGGAPPVGADPAKDQAAHSSNSS